MTVGKPLIAGVLPASLAVERGRYVVAMMIIRSAFEMDLAVISFKDLRLTYKDDDGDDIVITSDQVLNSAYLFCRESENVAREEARWGCQSEQAKVAGAGTRSAERQGSHCPALSATYPVTLASGRRTSWAWVLATRC